MTRLLITLQSMLATRRDDDRGATAVEYGLMVALIAAVIIGAVTLIGTSLRDVFNNIATALGGVVGG